MNVKVVVNRLPKKTFKKEKNAPVVETLKPENTATNSQPNPSEEIIQETVSYLGITPEQMKMAQGFGIPMDKICFLLGSTQLRLSAIENDGKKKPTTDPNPVIYTSPKPDSPPVAQPIAQRGLGDLAQLIPAALQLLKDDTPRNTIDIQQLAMEALMDNLNTGKVLNQMIRQRLIGNAVIDAVVNPPPALPAS